MFGRGGNRTEQSATDHNDLPDLSDSRSESTRWNIWSDWQGADMEGNRVQIRHSDYRVAPGREDVDHRTEETGGGIRLGSIAEGSVA